MKGFEIATIITIAVAAFVGQLLYKRVFEPALATQLKAETKAPEYRSSVDSFLDSY